MSDHEIDPPSKPDSSASGETADKPVRRTVRRGPRKTPSRKTAAGAPAAEPAPTSTETGSEPVLSNRPSSAESVPAADSSPESSHDREPAAHPEDTTPVREPLPLIRVPKLDRPDVPEVYSSDADPIESEPPPPPPGPVSQGDSGDHLRPIQYSGDSDGSAEPETPDRERSSGEEAITEKGSPTNSERPDARAEAPEREEPSNGTREGDLEEHRSAETPPPGRPNYNDPHPNSGRPYFKQGWKQHPKGDFKKGWKGGKFDKFKGPPGRPYAPSGPPPPPNEGGDYPPRGDYQKDFKGAKKGKFRPRERGGDPNGYEPPIPLELGGLLSYDLLDHPNAMAKLAEDQATGGEPLDLTALHATPFQQLREEAQRRAIFSETIPSRAWLIDEIIRRTWAENRPLLAEGVLETSLDGFGLLVFQHDNYKIKATSPFVSEALINRYGLLKGHQIRALVHPCREGETCPFVLKILTVMGMNPDDVQSLTPFEELIPYYPLERFILETSPDVKWDNFSMRIVDLLTPIGKGQRGLIVAPPRTGKTILQQGIANAVARNNPEAHLIVLLVDERPEEVTDFRRQVKVGEVIASTFDQNAESHVHCAEMVIERARRLVETGRHVIILLDSITRLARSYNTLAANSGKILSGGVEATALQRPKRFFGSARNIEGAGSLTILGTALVDTGSRMDEVIFEEFKGTGNMELHLDRALVDKRVFPAISLEKSGTRKEELLYHPDEMQKVYGLRRAMKGVPSTDAMEMLITRVRKTKNNIEFLLHLNR